MNERWTTKRCIDLIRILSFIKEIHSYLVVISVLLAFLSIAPISTGIADKSELMTQILGIEDPLINVNDLAFLLVTHDFDAMPKEIMSRSVLTIPSTNWFPTVGIRD